MSVIDAALGRSRTVLASLALLLATGLAAYITIPKESDPNINIPIIYVSMTHEGISPQDAERLLIRPMETELQSIEGVKEMRSTAYLGGANVLMEFDAGFDADTALADVREKVDMAKTELPNDTDEPSVNEVNLSLFPVLVVRRLERQRGQRRDDGAVRRQWVRTRQRHSRRRTGRACRLLRRPEVGRARGGDARPTTVIRRQARQADGLRWR